MKYDSEKYSAWKLPNLLLIHWILNPGIAFNEIVLGQRVPALTLIDKTSTAPLAERQYIPCPACGELHQGRLWSGKNAFGHWFGIICPSCGTQIPTLLNITSMLVLACLFPIVLLISYLFKDKWISIEKDRLLKMAQSGLPEIKKVAWVRSATIYGILMFCILSLPKLIKSHAPIKAYLLQGTIWALAGLLFGLIMWFAMGRKANRNRF